ncbi:MAG: hypothetical protein NVV59_17635 [Chitinophagaceae bacterium]|nr:hypothetical protein [Chitinophagaceae bacterium]
MNTSVPGLGLYNRQKIVSPERRTDNNSLDATPVRDESEVNGNIFSLEPEFIQSQTMEGVKQAILASHEQRSILKNDKSSVQKKPC